jgi:hypothetical protein
MNTDKNAILPTHSPLPCVTSTLGFTGFRSNPADPIFMSCTPWHAAAPLRAILEIAFAHIHSRFRTYINLHSRLRSWRPERQQSLHRRPTALRHRPISFASGGRTAAPPCVSRQSRDARRRVDHHGPRSPYAGGQSSRSQGATGRTDRPRPSCPQNPPPQPAYVRLQGPPAHGKVATLLLQETARPDERRVSWLMRSCNSFSDDVCKAGADAGFRVPTIRTLV